VNKPLGRPPKYHAIIEALDQHTLYSPAMVAMFAKENQMLERYRKTDESEQLLMQRIRVTMGRLTNNKAEFFPDEGDGIVTLPQQAPCPGWFGWRWHEVIKTQSDHC